MISKPYTPEPFRARRDDVIRARMRLAHASSAMNASDERDELLGDARSHDRAPSWAWKVAIGVACALAVAPVDGRDGSEVVEFHGLRTGAKGSQHLPRSAAAQGGRVIFSATPLGSKRG